MLSDPFTPAVRSRPRVATQPTSGDAATFAVPPPVAEPAHPPVAEHRRPQTPDRPRRPRRGRPAPLPWLIVGGGLHGVHLAVRLLTEGGVPADHLRLLDPGEHLLGRWHQCTAACGMGWLRSPGVHHLDTDPWSLHRFAGQSGLPAPARFTPPYDRPALSLFHAHCAHLIETHRLDALHLRDRALTCAPGRAAVAVGTVRSGTLRAARVVLALGMSEQPEWPTWAGPGHGCVQHVFDPGFAWPQAVASAVVVGGGITAAQVALRLIEQGATVTVLSRQALRTQPFDSDPGWLGPKNMAAFERLDDWGARRAAIDAARHRGSAPPEVVAAVTAAQAAGRLTWRLVEVRGAVASPEGVALTLADGDTLSAEQVLLATGFARRRPGGALVDDLVRRGLPCAACGYPLLDAELRWHPRVQATGPLAELVLGPTARNIAGARRAGDRLLRTLAA